MLERNPVALAEAPQLQQRELQQRQAGRLAENLFDQAIHEPILELQSDLLRGPDDRIAQLDALSGGSRYSACLNSSRNCGTAASCGSKSLRSVAITDALSANGWRREWRRRCRRAAPALRRR